MSAAPKGEPPVERRPGRQGEVRRGATILLGIGLGTLGLSNLSVDGAAAPPGGLTVTRRYDPAAAVTVFTVDIGEGSDSSLFLPACPRAQVLGVDGAGGAAVLEIPVGHHGALPGRGDRHVPGFGGGRYVGPGPRDERPRLRGLRRHHRAGRRDPGRSRTRPVHADHQTSLNRVTPEA